VASKNEGNLLFWPTQLAESPNTLTLRIAGSKTPPLGTQAQQRAYALIGPGATLVGLATEFLTRVLQPLVAPLPADDPRRRLAGAASLARALTQLATTVVGGTERFVVEWRTGTLFPLPMQQSAGGWDVFLDAISAVAVGNLLVPDPTHVPAADLVGPTAIPPIVDGKKKTTRYLPEPVAVLTDQVRVLVQGKTAGQVAVALAHDLFDNPSASCLRVVEALLQIEAAKASDARVFASSLAAQLLPPQLDVLAWTTAGTVVLRRLWSRLTTADPMYAPVATALGLAVRVPGAPGTPTVYFAPQERKPAVTPHEPPLNADQAVVRGNVVGALALGRRTTYGWTSYAPEGGKTWEGPSTPGVVSVRPFDAAHGASVPWPSWATLAQTTSRRHVVASIAPIEGEIDASRAADRGLLSLGCQQWSFHVNEEATILLEHFRRRSPDHFDVFFGVHDIGLALCDSGGKVDAALDVVPSKATMTVPAAAVRAANVHAFTPTGQENPPRDFYPTYVTLLQTQPAASPRVVDIDDGGDAPPPGSRFALFGWTSGGTNVASPVWTARGTVACQCSQQFQETELAVASFRFTRILDESAVWGRDWTTGTPKFVKGVLTHPQVAGLGGAPRAAPTGLRVGTLCPADHSVPDLFGTDFSGGLLLDAHINAPGGIKAAIMRTWQRTVDAYVVEATAALLAELGRPATPDEALARARTEIHVGASEQLADPFLRRLAVSFSALRGYFEWGSRNSVFPDRTFRMDFEHDLTLAPNAGSFVGWV
jgi:hypothetical protein